ncbi:MAG TPA: hypothetical protein PKC69_04935 [Chitinophagaceae bacterium]|nr:hypothetical protein [Chitinophagaceae bacterium]
MPEQAGVSIFTEEGSDHRLMEEYRVPPPMFTSTQTNAPVTFEQFVLKNKDISLIRDYTEAIGK